MKDEQIKKLKQKIGDLVVDNHFLPEALKPYRLAQGISDAGERPTQMCQNAGSVRCCRWLRPGCDGRPHSRDEQWGYQRHWRRSFTYLIHQHPTYDYRRLWALFWLGQRHLVHRMTVYRIIRVKRWLVYQRSHTAHPRAQGLRSRAPQSNHR